MLDENISGRCTKSEAAPASCCSGSKNKDGRGIMRRQNDRKYLGARRNVRSTFNCGQDQTFSLYIYICIADHSKRVGFPLSPAVIQSQLLAHELFRTSWKRSLLLLGPFPRGIVAIVISPSNKFLFEDVLVALHLLRRITCTSFSISREIHRDQFYSLRMRGKEYLKDSSVLKSARKSEGLCTLYL